VSRPDSNLEPGATSPCAKALIRLARFRVVVVTGFRPCSSLIVPSYGLQEQFLRAKQNAVSERFRTVLLHRLKKEGKLTVNSEAVDRIVNSR
jgi:hypothetical protein